MSRPLKTADRSKLAAAVMRYKIYRANHPKRICAELGVSRETLRNYVLAALRNG